MSSSPAPSPSPRSTTSSRTELAFEAIAARNGELNAFLAVREGAAGEDGVPLAVKDIFDTAALTTTYGSVIYRENVPERSAEVVLRLEQAGYSVVGKTNLHEFAYGVTSENPHFGPVRNPLDPARTAGGSSGGSAAALAAGMSDAALGSDTGGSIRIPAACCGVVGFKPTYGAVPTDGLFPLAPSFDHAGPMARTVAECAEVFAALTGRSVPAHTDLGRVRIGVPERFLEHCAPGVVGAVRTTLDLLPNVERIDFPPPDAFDFRKMFLPEAAAVHRDTFPEREADYGEDVARRLREGRAITALQYLEGREELGVYRAVCAASFAALDLLATATLPCVAPPLGTKELEAAGRTWSVRDLLTLYTRPFNSLGWPALAVPCGAAEDGLPASLQLIGRPGDDELVLAVGAEVETRLRETA